jgi:hypothetical protein
MVIIFHKGTFFSQVLFGRFSVFPALEALPLDFKLALKDFNDFKDLKDLLGQFKGREKRRAVRRRGNSSI